MFKLINFIVFLEIFTHFEFDACNAYQKSWDSGNKKLGKLRKSQKPPVTHCTGEPVWRVP